MHFKKTAGGFYLACNSTVVGDIKIGAGSSFWFNAVVRGDVAPITIGKRVNVQDCAVVHVDTGVPNDIGDDVTIGHSAVVHGRSVGSGTLIGMSATVLSRTKIGSDCLIAAGAVVPPDMVIPDGSLVVGVPAKVVRKVRDEDLKYMRWLIEHYMELAQKYVDGEFKNIE